MTRDLTSILAMPLVGEGNFRRVYSDGVSVYKIEYGMGIDLECNRAEIENLNSLRDVRLPDNVRLPAAYLYVTDGIPVLAMQYIPGEPVGGCFCLPGEAHEGCLPPGIERDLNVLGIDLAYGNVILSDGTYYLVDLDADLR